MHINTNFQLKISNESIKLVIDQGSARCKFFLKRGYKIDFVCNDTFRDILGFDAVVVDQPLTESFKICDTVISTNIYLHLDIARGSICQEESKNIIYSFPNNIAFGYLINLNIRQNKKTIINEKILFRFDSIVY